MPHINSKGQVSIFFSTTIVVMITFIAFIINIGIFVKAKINLQNATDAAAYAGASVQARQLTNIAYLNWEMRNVFKEWMFKYYVLGSLNLEKVATDSPDDKIDFTMQASGLVSNPIKDPYNFPSSCVDFAGSGGVGLCTKYLVPGLPRFASSNVLGMDETTNAFVDSIVAEKAEDCSLRTKLNFLTANTWAYNVITSANKIDEDEKNISQEAPEIGIDRMGAFPQAFELGIRIRNLEAQVNHAPMNGICLIPGDGINCNTSINSLRKISEERALKAFQTGWRNIGTSDDRKMKNSFTLKELSPVLGGNLKSANNLSTILIPENSSARNKFYLDLKLMTLNYAVFYTAFTSNKGDVKVDGQVINAEGECAATKIGLPVPGYPLGFVKNPDFLTYYAIETKAKFIGLFNPFSPAEIELSAYAAAKPFGGRIGPMLFDVSDGKRVSSRTNKLSSAYISGLNTLGFTDAKGNIPSIGEYSPGMPVPINGATDAARFWIRDQTDAVGGVLAEEAAFFGIPNIIWDYPKGDPSNRQGYLAPDSTEVQEIAVAGFGSPPGAGLYNTEMFNKLKKRLPGVSTKSVSSNSIDQALTIVRAPTLYETHNYLIPTPEDLNLKVQTDSWGAISGNKDAIQLKSDDGDDYDIYNLKIYAPLISADPDEAIYQNATDLIASLNEYLLKQATPLKKYRSSMNTVAAHIFNNNSSATSGVNTGQGAARQLSNLLDIDYKSIEANPSNADNFLPTCDSITGKFLFLYAGAIGGLVKVEGACPTSIAELLTKRWANPELTGDLYQNVKYALPVKMSEELFSAYRPGPSHDAGISDGVLKHPILKDNVKMIRNFYSTKFIPLKSLTRSSSTAYSPGTLPIYSEGELNETNSGNEAKRKEFSNPLTDNELSRDLEDLHH